MKNKITIPIGFIFFLAIFSQFLFAQITVNLHDFDWQFEYGNKIYTYYDKTNSTINIGSTNSSSWDFSNLRTDETFEYDIINPSTTPFRPDYPSSDMAFDILLNQVHQQNFEFYCFSPSYVHLHGTVYTSTTTPGNVTKVIYKPVKIHVFVPMTYYTSWKDTVLEKTIIENNGNVISEEDKIVISNALVDAYGPLTLPGSLTVNALRVRIDQTTIKGDKSEIKRIYKWFDKTGESVVIETDTSSSIRGLINVEGKIKWMLNSEVTGITEKNKIPDKFKLNQNYPNPFNPSTSIEYSIPEESHVQIKVYSTIGKEVATLEDGRKTAGVYSISFNGSNLTSGIYFVKMSAGTFNQVIKMTMVK